MSAISKFFAKILAFILALFGISHGTTADTPKDYVFTVDASTVISDELVNPASNVNIWSIYKTSPLVGIEANEENNVFDFVEYVQLMQCTGGSYARDLFKDPYDSSVLDDYDFTALIENCRGILKLGAKPVLKLGSVPMKYTADAVTGAFLTNVYPPDDYNIYYNYIKAIAEALVEQFGYDEVLSWRFTVMTEYENQNWFKAKSGTAEDTAIEYCKLYDYTVQALIDVLGNDVCVGAHSMTVTEGFWDEAIFINHCACGTNYANGKVGSKLNYLAASFYDSQPGKYTSGKSFLETIEYLRSTAEKAGLNDLFYGIDEGRIVSGNTSGADSQALISRTCGYTYQAAYDARLYKTMLENDIDYLSSWYYLSGGLFEGNPTISYHTAKLVSGFSGSRLVSTSQKANTTSDAEVEAVSAFDSKTNTLRIMAYNFKNDIDYDTDVTASFEISVPQFSGEQATVTTYMIDDDCNFFDDWIEDRKALGITNDCFSWSPDDPTIDNVNVLKDADAVKIYKTTLFGKYTECSKLTPTVNYLTADSGKIELDLTLSGNTVVFYEIQF